MSIRYDVVSLNEFCGRAFVAFFIIQTIGFLVIQFKRKRLHGVFQSALGFGLLIVWYSRSPMTGVIEDEVGRVLFWGEKMRQWHFSSTILFGLSMFS